MNVAPETVLFAPGGTRRRAALAGVSPQSDEYARWSRERMITCIDVFFRCGVRNLFASMLRPPQLAETGHYRERLMSWLDWGLSGPEALADYQRLGWRVRLAGAEHIPELQDTVARLQSATPMHWQHTVWWYVSPEPESHWTLLLEAAQRTQARTQAEIIRAMYGEDIVPARLCLSFGKPMIAADMLPLVLAGDIQCYWMQRPGFELDDIALRSILYDYAYLRSTWTQDKSQRYTDITTQRAVWEQPLILGLGRRIGGFWYPMNDPIIPYTGMKP